MSIRKLKRWHWTFIGILIGTAIALARLSLASLDSTPVGLGQEDFERLLRAPPALGQYPALDHINIIPIEGVYWVRAQRRYPLADGRGFEYRTEWLALRNLAYAPLDKSIQTSSSTLYTVRDYLKGVSAQFPQVSYRYAWERDRKIAVPLSALVGALVIGGLWPILLRSLVAAETPADDYDLSRFSSSPTTEEPPANQQKLLALESELESKLAANSLPSQPAASLPPEPPKVLHDTPLAPVADCTEEKKDYEGEFYPTEAHAHAPKASNH